MFSNVFGVLRMTERRLIRARKRRRILGKQFVIKNFTF